MKKLSVLLLAMGLFLSGCANTETNEAKDLSEVKIGAIQFAQHPALDKSYEGFKDVLVEAGVKEENIDFQNASGDGSNCTTIVEKFVNDGDDLIYAIATDALQAAANQTTEIPIVGASVTDFETAGVVKSNEKPETNVTGASDLNPVQGQMELLKTLIPDAKKVAIFYCSDEANSIFQGKIALDAAKELGLDASIVTVSSDSSAIQQVAQSMVGKYDAVYIPTDNLLASNMATVAQVTNENKLPVIVGEESMCQNGGLATLSLDYYTVGQNAGKQALAILKGEAKVEETPVAFVEAKDCQYFVNEAVAKQLGIEIPEDLNATMIGE
ncbi:ABC transporter substrate-binding protein [Allocoprobacillus halotolerans]|uniref:ABC transporter substrate-binding protein n=1 Tax=Allocoprobacillus halotolerans TaxID=2944914 RepID=A0ABY5I328_9FIRM|nr:ABC transporter substrate-binding protein [Allocoprobacillus halotolerans]UTY39187.1 ABC transporter substrate-binding protein [Allocoprobacillus halotolerans]